MATLRNIAELKVHTKIEEDICYPASAKRRKKEEDTGLYFEALEEHHVVDLVLPEIRKPIPTQMIRGKGQGLEGPGGTSRRAGGTSRRGGREADVSKSPRLMEKEQLLELGRQMAELSRPSWAARARLSSRPSPGPAWLPLDVDGG